MWNAQVYQWMRLKRLQEAQTKIMETLSVIKQAPLSNGHLVTQIDLQNLKKELSTELNNELVGEIRKIMRKLPNFQKHL